MQALSTTLLSALLSSILAAQSGIGWIDQDPNTAGVQNWKLSEYFTSKPGTGSIKTMGDITLPNPIWSAAGGIMIQVSTGKTGINGLAPGEFHMCLTTTYLSASYGGTGTTQQVVMGMVTWNSGAPVFTPNTMANNMNTAGNVFGLMIDDKDGLVAAVDWPSGAVVSQRSSTSVPFPTPVPVGGVTGTYVDPAPGYIDGQLVLFWVDNPGALGNIVYAPLTLQTVGGQLTATVGTAVILIATPGRISHSPTPICGANGDALGMWFASRVGNDSDMYFTPSIKSATPFAEWDNGTAWVNNGGVAGGRILAASNVADGYYGRLLEGQGYYMVANSDLAIAPSAQLTLKVGAQSDATIPLCSSLVAVALRTIGPVPIGGILGSFGLNPSPMFFPVPPGIFSVTSDDIGEMQLPATDPSLKGATLYFQALTTPVQPASPAFTNTTQVKLL